MGLRDNVWIAGNERDVCGWALLGYKRQTDETQVELTYEGRPGKVINRPESSAHSNPRLSVLRSSEKVSITDHRICNTSRPSCRQGKK